MGPSQSLPFWLTTKEDREQKENINHSACDRQVRGGTILAKTTLRRAPIELFILWQGTASSVLYIFINKLKGQCHEIFCFRFFP
jgi:hypothetical protein